jgi:hypothetical protein
MHREFVVAATVCAVVAGAWAQQAPDFLPGTMGTPSDANRLEWNELEVPAPPVLRKDGLIPIEVGGTFDLRYGVDPQSIALGADDVVRYVVVATSQSGVVNALYEGLRCNRAEYRVYARSSGEAWRATEMDWRSLSDPGTDARHARTIARGGACFGPAPNRSAQQIAHDLREPPDRKFGGSRAP